MAGGVIVVAILHWFLDDRFDWITDVLCTVVNMILMIDALDAAVDVAVAAVHSALSSPRIKIFKLVANLTVGVGPVMMDQIRIYEEI